MDATTPSSSDPRELPTNSIEALPKRFDSPLPFFGKMQPYAIGDLLSAHLSGRRREAKKCGFDTHGGRLFRDLTSWARSAKIESTVSSRKPPGLHVFMALSPQG